MHSFFMKAIYLIDLILLSACKPAQTSVLGKQVEIQNGVYTQISVDELQPILENKDFVLVNVHVPFDGDIPDTDISIPYDQIAQNLDRLPANKNTKIML